MYFISFLQLTFEIINLGNYFNVTGVDPYTAKAYYVKIGKDSISLSFKDIANGRLHGFYDTILSFNGSHMSLHLLTMAYFLVARGGALSHCESWCTGHANPLISILTSQKISELLKKQTEDERQTFFTKWCEKISENDYLCYDITSVSSYSELNEYMKYGYGQRLLQ